MRIASFNVENMFRRAVALNLATWKDGKVILEQYARANALLQEPVYTVAIKASIIDALEKLGLKKGNESAYLLSSAICSRPRVGATAFSRTPEAR